MLLTKKLFHNTKKSTENRKGLPIKVDGKVVFFA